MKWPHHFVADLVEPLLLLGGPGGLGEQAGHDPWHDVVQESENESRHRNQGQHVWVLAQIIHLRKLKECFWNKG